VVDFTHTDTDAQTDVHSHTIRPIKASFPGEPRQASCPLDFPSPFILRLCSFEIISAIQLLQTNDGLALYKLFMNPFLAIYAQNGIITNPVLSIHTAEPFAFLFHPTYLVASICVFSVFVFKQ